MVKFRGIEISIISQFDIRKLPEYSFRRTSPSPESITNSPQYPKATASCYVPVYPGSQIWFEYNIDGPHPPNAAYFFKLLFNGREITSFDCGSKHSYNGKMMYNLMVKKETLNTAEAQIVRQALHFASEVDGAGTVQQEDVIEFRVHRIEHRKRIREFGAETNTWEFQAQKSDRLKLTDGGLLEPGFPQRRYQYQLLDPVDEPYATFEFLCRSFDHLEKHELLDRAANSSSSSIYSQRLRPEDIVMDSSCQTEANCSSVSDPSQDRTDSTPHSVNDSNPGSRPEPELTLNTDKSMASDIYLPQSDSDEELSIITKDSLEDLPSTLLRSPRSPRYQALSDEPNEHETLASPSPAKPPGSPRRKLKKKLTVSINGADFDLNKGRRSLSPFNSSGMLRKFTPPSAPAAVTAFGPNVQEEVEQATTLTMHATTSQERLPLRTTRNERGGKSLMGFLSRRIAIK